MDALTDADLDDLVDGPQDAASSPTREEMLEAIPLHIVIDPDVDLDAEDPSMTRKGRRLCISTRRAGGRCTASATSDGYLCSIHAGLVDPSTGGHARARKLREASHSNEEKARLGRLGTRGVIRDALASEATKVQRTVQLLLTAASEGDLQAAKAVIPWLNQGLGMPTETVVSSNPASADDVEAMDTASLQALVAERRASRGNSSDAAA